MCLSRQSPDVTDADSREGAVRSVIRLGGDTDTPACIAGGVAEAIYGMPDATEVEARRYLTTDLLDVLDRFLVACHPV